MAPVVKPNSFQPNILDSVLVVNLAEEIPARGCRRCHFLSSAVFDHLLQSSPNCKRILLIHILPPLPFPHHMHFKNKGLAQSRWLQTLPRQDPRCSSPSPSQSHLPRPGSTAAAPASELQLESRNWSKAPVRTSAAGQRCSGHAGSSPTPS